MLLTCGGVAACHARRTNGIQAAHERHTRGVTGTLARRPYDGLHAAETGNKKQHGSQPGYNRLTYKRLCRLSRAARLRTEHALT